MDNRKIQTSFQQALTEYEVVINELSRPKRDVVMVAACDMIKKSIEDFLRAYLLVHDIEMKDQDLAGLYKKCLMISDGFRALDMDTILCLIEEHADTCQRCL